MSIKLDCPVCGYKEIEKDVCPNCDTDLSLIRMLQELPQLDVSCLEIPPTPLVKGGFVPLLQEQPQLDVSCLEIPPTPLHKGGFVPSFLIRVREDRVSIVTSFLIRAREDRIKIATWQLIAAAIILLIGMGLGMGSSLFFQPQQIAVITPNNQAVISSPQPSPIPAKPQEPTSYTVKFGDSLSLITERLCTEGTHWQVMVQANPQLRGRENYIDKGEVFKIPNCKEAI